MWQKFGAGIWEALAKKYLEIDMNDVSWWHLDTSIYLSVYHRRYGSIASLLVYD